MNEYIKTGKCEKCGRIKTWDYWYHNNPNLCDDCYYINGRFYKMATNDVKKIIAEEKKAENQRNKKMSDINFKALDYFEKC